MPKLTPRAKLGTARLMAKERLPYFTSGLYMLAPVWVPDGTISQHGTMGVTDNWVLLIEESALRRWTVAQTAGALVHEMLHPLREHGPRARAVGATTPPLAKLWNFAADAEINDDIFEAGLELPEGSILPKTFGLEAGRTAEQYYRELLDQVGACAKCRGELDGDGQGDDQDGQGSSGSQGDQEGEEGDGQGAGGEGSDEGSDGSGEGSDGSGEGQSEGQQGSGKGSSKCKCPLCSGHGDKPGVGGGWCGSGAGRPVPGEQDRSKEVQDAGRSQVEADSVKKKIANDIQEAVQKSRGTIPAGWARWADDVLQPPKIDWRTKLAQVARNAIAYRAGAVDFKYSRTSRRQSVLGFGKGCPRLPALLRPVPHVAIAIDTSGSMSTQDLKDAVAESEGILRSVGSDVTFISCDAAVGAVKRVSSVDELVANLVGGGGTDFAPVFKAIEKLQPRPEVLVYATDGCGPAPALPVPGLHTIWLLIGKYRQEPWFAGGEPWGEMIHVDDLGNDAEAA